MPPSSGELWGHHLMPTQVLVDCFMPTGVIIPLRCNRDATMERIKSDLWVEAKKQPLFHKLLDPSSYIFVGITQDAEREEFFDETRRLCDLRLFQPILKVVEPKGNREEKMLNYEIGQTVGIPISEFNEMNDLEVMTFRRNILNVCKDAVDERKRNGKHSLALYTYPPDIESSAKLPPHLEEKLQQTNKSIMVCVWVVQQDKSRNKYTVKLPHTGKPNDVIAETIRRRSRNMGRTKEETERCIEGFCHTYVLKVCGCDQFLFEGFPISQYKYVRESIASGKIPQLMLLTKENVYSSLRETNFTIPAYVQRGIQALTDINNTQTRSLLDIHQNFKIRVHCATYVNVKELGKIYVKASIYQGTEPLCEVQQTKEVDSTNPRWNQWLEFLDIRDIPRSARICFSICSVSKRKNKKSFQTHYALAWGNLQVFDFNNLFLNDKVSLQLWPMPQGMDELLNPIGIPGSNPNKDCPCLEIEFERFSPTLVYPGDSQLEDLAIFAANKDSRTQIVMQADDWKQEEVKLLDIIGRDPLYEMSEQDKELLWKRRDYCLHQPNSLPKLLCAIKWNDRENVAQLYMLLKQWPTVTPEVALQLLDCSYTDLKVRQFAVHCLEIGMTDDKLQQYLLQLVQALKFEPYLDNPVARFLLKRALLNQRIGQQLFWHLKSELHHKATRIRFGLILEAFCRGCGPFLHTLSKQVEALEKMTKLTNMLKYDVKDDKDELMKCLHEQLQQPDYQECLQGFISPLNNSNRLGTISSEECIVKMSKKRPLWMVWMNPDPLADLWYNTYTILFKNGDDLRQDMLTLQIIRVMDHIWKAEGLDLRMLPYGCLATGQDVGLIEAVRNSETIMKIQGKGGAKAALQMASRQLHNWIKMNNQDRYEEAIEGFTKSCAGYCVATFVLGIGDRHSENIMLSRDGKVFHIDFGHFLNHKKKKFGINRERVPFVLTEDFMIVIAKGKDQPHKQEEFKSFQDLCCRAYLVLRKHADLIINLFTMMLSCGIPELQSLEDVGYVRKTLAVEKTEEQAVEYFIQQFSAAYKDQWTTKFDWFFHNIRNK